MLQISFAVVVSWGISISNDHYPIGIGMQKLATLMDENQLIWYNFLTPTKSHSSALPSTLHKHDKSTNQTSTVTICYVTKLFWWIVIFWYNCLTLTKSLFSALPSTLHKHEQSTICYVTKLFAWISNLNFPASGLEKLKLLCLYS